MRLLVGAFLILHILNYKLLNGFIKLFLYFYIVYFNFYIVCLVFVHRLFCDTAADERRGLGLAADEFLNVPETKTAPLKSRRC